MKGIRSHSKANGAALLLTLWCVAMVSLVSLEIVGLIAADTDTESLRTRRFEARQLALTGVSFGINPGVGRESELLRSPAEANGNLVVTITSESSRLNINRLLREKGTPVLRRLFSQWGVPDADVSAAIDSLLDWTDANDLVRLNGAERDQLQGQTTYSLPQNRDFRSLDEVQSVRGMDVIAKARPDWKECLSVFGGEKVDIQDATLEVMQAAGLSAEQAALIVGARAGDDGVAGTRDDIIFKDFKTVAAALSNEPGVVELLEERFAIDTEPMRVESRATVAGTRYQVTVVSDRRQRVSYLWEER